MKKVTGAKVMSVVVALTMCLNSVPTMALAESEGEGITEVSETEERTEESVSEESTPTEESKAEDGAQEGIAVHETLDETNAGVRFETASGTKYYATLKEAFADKITGGGTVTLLKDQLDTERVIILTDDAGITLDLNGHCVYGDQGSNIRSYSLQVGNFEEMGKVTVINSGISNTASYILVNSTGILTINDTTVKVNNYNTQNRISVSIWGNGELHVLRGFVQILLGSGSGALRYMNEFLGEGVAYYTNLGGWMEYETAKKMQVLESGESYYVRQCYHPDIVTDENGKSNCKYCNTGISVERKYKDANNDTTRYFTNLESMINNKGIIKAGTVKLLDDEASANAEISSGTYTLDLNGKTMDKLKISGGTVNIKNTAATEGKINSLSIGANANVTLGIGTAYGSITAEKPIGSMLTQNVAIKIGERYATAEELENSEIKIDGISIVEAPLRITEEPSTTEVSEIVYGGKSSPMKFVFSEEDVTSADNATITYEVYDAKQNEVLKKSVVGSLANGFDMTNILHECAVGEYTLIFSVKYKGYTTPRRAYPFRVLKSTSEISASPVKETVAYTDKITISGRVTFTGTAASTDTNNIGLYSNGSTTKDIEVYYDGRTIATGSVNPYNFYTVEINASTIGAGEKTLTVKYIGNENMAAADTTVTVTVEKATPTINWNDYPNGKSYTGSPIANPKANEISITNGKFSDITFKWYRANKDSGGNYTKVGEQLSGNPVNAGDYIIEAVFAETTNTKAVTYQQGITISKKESATENGKTIDRYVDVYITPFAQTYEVDLKKALEGVDGIIENDVFTANTQYGFVGIEGRAKSASIIAGENKLEINMDALGADSRDNAGKVELYFSSTNYNQIKMVFFLNAVNKQEGKLNVTMDNWTYGDTAKTPDYTLPKENPREETVLYAKQDGTKLDAVPTDAGEYTVTVKAEYDDSVYTGSADFKIVPKDISSNTVNVEVTLDHNTFEYDGTRKKANVVSVTVDGKLLDSEEYGVFLASGTDAGAYTITIIGNDIDAFTGRYVGNYTGEYDANWSITPKPVTAALEITGADTYTYTGSAIEPTVIAKDGETVIPESEYTVSYANNKNAGTANITVSDNDGGNYTVSGGTTFTINKAKVVIKALDKTMRKGKDAPDLSNPVAGTDYEVTGLLGDDKLEGTVTLSYSSDLDTGKVGTAEIIPAATGINGNYEAEYQNGTLEIRKRSSSSSGGGDSTVSNPTEMPSTDDSKADSSADGTKQEDGAKQEDGTKQTIVKMQIDSRNLSVNGVIYEKDEAPVIRNDRTLVPIRFITESLGGKVDWNGVTKEVTLNIDGKEIKMTVGKTLEKYGVAPVIMDGRTFVPVRFVADELGATVAWDDATKTVTITK